VIRVVPASQQATVARESSGREGSVKTVMLILGFTLKTTSVFIELQLTKTMRGDHREITALRDAVRVCQSDAKSRLLTLVHTKRKLIARDHLRLERPEHTLEPSDLVHEPYFRMTRMDFDGENQVHCFGIAAHARRNKLVDHARAHAAVRRGGGKRKHALNETLMPDICQARVVELRFFAGLSTEEGADVLGRSSRTVRREWRIAQAWLRRELSREN
jgi:RNA polymerase sigma-70 factor (ECF subfamily)